jgi:hypothetical protein
MSIIDKKILEELNRHNSINKYITEQEAVPGQPETPAIEPMGTEQPTAEVDPMLDTTATAEPEVIDVNQDDEVEKISDTGEVEDTLSDTGTEELDITDLVTTQKSMGEKQTEYFDMMFKQLEGLQTKLAEMDGLVQQLNSLEQKIEKYRPKTPEEKLELRSLDSGPYQQKLSDFFQDKQGDMEKTGKNEYVLTSDEVENIVPNEIKQSFDNYSPEPTDSKFRMS